MFCGLARSFGGNHGRNWALVMALGILAARLLDWDCYEERNGLVQILAFVHAFVGLNARAKCLVQ